MDFRFSPEDQALRDEAIEFTRKEWDPKGYGYGGGGGLYFSTAWDHEDEGLQDLIKEFAKKLVAKGWWTMHWPAEFGGGAASITRQMAYQEGMAYAAAPASLAGGFIAPVLMLYGADWMKQEVLPQIGNADLEISQGFSEPDAGSDLANLKTRAVRDGDEYVVTGQKIWGTYRNPWVHILVRTDPEAPKHRGITYLLARLKDDDGNYLPGITVRAVPDSLGRHRWDELFLENVRVPTRNVIGEENRGWYAAMATLSFERSGIGMPTMLIRVIEDFVDYSRQIRQRAGSGPLDNPVVRNQLAEWRIECEMERMLSYRVGWMQSQGLVPDREPSMIKVSSDRIMVGLFRFISRSLGEYGNLLPGSGVPLPWRGFVNASAVFAQGFAIASGTTEIQKNLIAQRGLGLPR
jgi:alkylation response protein AidB-like acyl-CoA dehydrogenase